MAVLLMVHVVLRWVVVVAGAAGVVAAGVAWAGNRPIGSAERALSRVFAVLLTVQGAVGAVLLIAELVAGSGLSTGGLVHLGVMLTAIGLAHSFPNRPARNDAAGHRNRLVGIGLSTVLTFVGVAALSLV